MLLENLTAEQLAEWEAYDSIDPVGDWKMDFHFANILSAMVNIAIKVHGRQGTPPVKITDFMVEWDIDKPVEQQSAEDMKTALLQIARAHNTGLSPEEVKRVKSRRKRNTKNTKKRKL